MTIKSIISTVSVILILAACQYEPELVNYQEVDPDFDKFQADFTVTPDADTITTYVKTTIDYKYTSDLNKLRFVRFVVDSNVVDAKTDSAGTFFIDPEEDIFNTGEHEVIVEALVSSGTGSLADKLEAEGLWLKKTYHVKIVEFNDYTTKFVSLKEKNGSLEIIWTKIDMEYFSHYELLRKCYDDTVAFGTYSKDDTTYIDSSYIGGKCEYCIYGVNTFGNKTKFTSTIYTDTLPKLKIIQTGGKTVSFSWERAKYYKNIEGYELTSGNYMSNDSRITFIENPDISFYDFDGSVFGEKNIVNLVVYPNGATENPDKIIYEYVSTVEYKLGDESFDFDAFQLLKSGKVIFIDNDRLIYYDLINNTELNALNDIKVRAFAISPQNSYLAVQDLNWDFHIYEFPSFNKIAMIPDDSIKIDSKSFLYVKSISDNARAAFYQTGYPNDRLYIYDVKEGKVLLSDTTTVYGVCKLSSNGNHIVIHEDYKAYLSKIENDKLTTLRFFNDPDQNFNCFHYPDGSGKTMIFNNGKLMELDFKSNTVLDEFDTGQRRLLNFDFDYGMALFSDTDYSVYDYKRKTKVFEIKKGTSNSPVFNFSDYLYSKGKVIKY